MNQPEKDEIEKIIKYVELPDLFVNADSDKIFCEDMVLAEIVFSKKIVVMRGITMAFLRMQSDGVREFIGVFKEKGWFVKKDDGMIC